VATAIVDDFERQRRIRETANERLVCILVVCAGVLMLLVESAWRAVTATAGAPGDFVVTLQTRLVTLAIVVSHLVVLGLLAVRPDYDPRRKYLLVVTRVALMGAMCWAQWFNLHPEYGLLVPSGPFLLLVVLSGLSFSRAAVVLAGTLSCVTYCTVTLLGPAWPLSVRACGLTAQGFVVATVVTFFIVDGMLRMHARAVSNERLSRFFAPEIAARITHEPEAMAFAVESRVTVLFTDISGFTAMSSTMQPQHVMGLLNDYFPTMVDIVFRHGGTLEKFVGDALLAIWGAPFAHADDADRAVAAAIEMQRAVGPLNARLAAAGHPPIAIHVGLSSGPAAAGYVGTERYVQYAVIGDTTNVASRVCSAAGAGEILVTEATRAALGLPGVRLEPLPPVAVKGKVEPLVLHRVVPSEATA